MNSFFTNPKLQTLELSDGLSLSLSPPSPLPWFYPNDLAYHYSVNRKGFNKTPFLKQFKKFLATEQEAVFFLSFPFLSFPFLSLFLSFFLFSFLSFSFTFFIELGKFDSSRGSEYGACSIIGYSTSPCCM